MSKSNHSAELNADALFTILPVTVGVNVHITAGRQMITDKWNPNYFSVEIIVHQTLKVYAPRMGR